MISFRWEIIQQTMIIGLPAIINIYLIYNVIKIIIYLSQYISKRIILSYKLEKNYN